MKRFLYYRDYDDCLIEFQDGYMKFKGSLRNVNYGMAWIKQGHRIMGVPLQLTALETLGFELIGEV